MTQKKHIGRIANTDRRCVVVFMQIPGREDHALIVDTDALPDRYHDSLMEVVESLEGQSTPVLATLLNRRFDSTLGIDIMTMLHQAGYLQAVHVDRIIMFPEPNRPIPLRAILEAMANNPAIPRDETLEPNNRIQDNQLLDKEEQLIGVARNLLIQAENLVADAARKRSEAYQLAPSLRPKSPQASNASEETERLGQVIVSESTVETMASDERVTFKIDVADLDPETAAEHLEVARIAAEELRRSLLSEQSESIIDPTEAAHGIEPTDERLQEFLDRAAAFADKSGKTPIVEVKEKRPVGRPRKNPPASKAS